MSEELKPCLVCKSVDHLGTEEYGDDPEPGWCRSRISCECGFSGPWYSGPKLNGHISAWNALPRTQGAPSDREKRMETAYNRLKDEILLFAKETANLPVQHEDESKGCCSYNWHRPIANRFLAALADTTNNDNATKK